MSRRAGALWFLALSAFFLLLNHSAYRGFFDNDDIECINWVRLLDWPGWIHGFLSPLFQVDNFRPSGHLFFREAAFGFGADFWKYVAALQVIHLFNCWLVWVLARRLEAKPAAAGAACFLFAIHPAFFEAVWKPMYAFDVLCATFCLLCLIFYSQRRWVLSFAAFWLAYKSKELAIMLPAALLAYEVWFGERKWLRLAPFFAVSLSFGLQGIFLNPNHNNDYTFHFTPEAVWRTSSYYSSEALLLPFAGFLLPVAAWFARSRRAWFGVALMAALFVPLLFLPGRIFAAYCYAPFIGLALAFSGLVQAMGNYPSLVFCALLFPVDPQRVEVREQELLAQDARDREWFYAVDGAVHAHPKPGAVIYRGAPVNYGPSGCAAIVQFLYDDLGVGVFRDDDPRIEKDARAPELFLDWDGDRQAMRVEWKR